VEHETPTVFLSWAHRHAQMSDAEAEAWKRQVRALYEQLEVEGVVVHLDLYDHPADPGRWANQMINECDFTLIVPSRAYKECWDDTSRSGEEAATTREINILRGCFDKDQGRRARTLVVRLPGVTDADIPDEIYSTHPRYPVDPNDPQSLEELLHHLWNVEMYTHVDTGKPANLSPAPRVTAAAESDAKQNGQVRPDTSGKLSALPSASSHYPQILSLIELANSLAPPPEPPKDFPHPSGWVVRAGVWLDAGTQIIDECEALGRSIKHPPKASFLQAVTDARAAIKRATQSLRNATRYCDADSISRDLTRLHNEIRDLVAESVKR
jgi:hypothetical protein